MKLLLSTLVLLGIVIGPVNNITAEESEPPLVVLPVDTTRVTSPFLVEHEAVRGHLRHMTQMVGDLPGMTATEQKGTMAHVTGCMTTNILDHAAWEENVLYPLVDKYAGTAEAPNKYATLSLRHEHKIIGIWATGLENEASKAEPDVAAFCRLADNLLGLVQAHFEEEEVVLLPILDTSMTADEFKTQVADKMESRAH